MSHNETEKTAIASAAIKPWQETFLARYPRSLKVTLFLIALIMLVSPAFFKAIPTSMSEEKKTLQSITKIQGADTQAAIANPKLDTSDNGTAPVAGAFASLNDQDDRTVKLSVAPDIGLTEDTAEGSLPRVGEDGRQPWQVYARPFNMADKRPRVAIVITDLGLSRVATDAAIDRLPANVTLAFDVQSPVVGAWCGRARQDGHETLLSLPMEPFDYPRSDPGPNALLTTLPNADNLARLLGFLRQSTGYIGITTLSGSRFTTDPDKLTPILDALHQRGLMIFDARVAPHSAVMDLARNEHVAAAASNQRLDQNLDPDQIDAALNQLEQTARLTGHAIGITAPIPIVLDRLQVWLKNLPQRGVALAPVSAMVQ